MGKWWVPTIQNHALFWRNIQSIKAKSQRFMIGNLCSLMHGGTLSEILPILLVCKSATTTSLWLMVKLHTKVMKISPQQWLKINKKTSQTNSFLLMNRTTVTTEQKLVRPKQVISKSSPISWRNHHRLSNKNQSWSSRIWPGSWPFSSKAKSY